MKPLLHIDTSFFTPLNIIEWGYTEEAKPSSWQRLDDWTQQGLHRPLNYLNDQRKELRQDLKLVYPEFQSALVFLFSYQETKKWMMENNHHEVAAYSLGFGGEDYHFAIKRRLQVILDELKKEHPTLESFISLDTQPILERDLAYRAGLGWFGKNSMLIHQKQGSYFLIGTLLLNQKLPLPPAEVDIDHCGQCIACVEACPTNAIDPISRTIKAINCISTFTIETFKEVPAPDGAENSRGEVFGCDICQDVCPWNRKPLERVISGLNLNEKFTFLKNWFFEMPKEKLKEMISLESNRTFKKRLQGTVFDRPGKIGWLKNFKK